MELYGQGILNVLTHKINFTRGTRQSYAEIIIYVHKGKIVS